MHFHGLLTDWAVIFCRPGVCLCKGFTDGTNPVVGTAAKMLVDVDASIAMTCGSQPSQAPPVLGALPEIPVLGAEGLSNSLPKLIKSLG